MKKLFSLMLALAMCLAILPTNALAQESITYIDENNTKQTLTEYQKFEPGLESYNGWYVVDENTTADFLEFSGSHDITLVLTNDCTLTFTNGISGSASADATAIPTLTIYTDGGNEKLIAGSVDSNRRHGIYISGNLNLYGGKIIAQGGNLSSSNAASLTSAGISVDTGVLTIRNCEVYATGGDINISKYNPQIYSYGILADTENSISIQNSTVVAKGGNLTVSARSYGEDEGIEQGSAVARSCGFYGNMNQPIYTVYNSDVNCIGGANVNK